MSPRPSISEIEQMVESAVCVAVGFQILVCRPADTDDSSTGYHPGTNDNHQGVSCSVQNGHEEGLSGL
jgi:hypothetical protein